MVVALIGDIALNGAELAASLAPVPWLKPAVGLVKNIVELVENVPKNKKAAGQLAGCCNNLYNGVKASCSDKHPDAVKKAAEELINFLEKVKQKMESWNKEPAWKRFLMQEQIADDIKESLQDVLNFSSKMGLVTQLEQFTMMADYEENRKADMVELMKFLHDKESEDELRWVAQKAREDRQTEMLEVLLRLMTEVSTTFSHKDERNIAICKNMYAMQRASDILLPDVALPSNLVRKTTEEVAGGSVFSIYEGLYCEKQKCAIKAVRPLSNADPKTRERLEREAEIWRMVCKSDEHKEYILPFLGVCYDTKPWPWLVSPWMQKGDAAQYVKSHDGVNHRRLIHRIAIGVSILHTHDPPIVHGHLKGSHVLIDDRGDPFLTDFGLSKLLVGLKGVPVSEIRGISASWRWFAPETMTGEGLLTEKSDVYSYAMTVLELMTHKQPYAEVSLTVQAVTLVSNGIKPQKPTDPEIVKRGLNDKLWDLLCRCWNPDPEERPTIQEVLGELPKCGHF